MISLRRFLFVGGVMSLLCSFQCTVRHSEPSVRLLTIDSTTRLEVVDWGGRGVSLVFLAGLGHTAHVFDEFAVRLTDRYHVVGITRRGFGASSKPESGYDIQRLAEDIQIVLDSLPMERVVLVGHSLGGDEMTLLAHRHPERVAALVYLEAAYRHATWRDSMARYPLPHSSIPPPTGEDVNSAEAYQAYYARANGVTVPLSEIRALYRWEPDGRFGGSANPSFVFERILESLSDQDYSGIDIPSLAIYGTDYPVTELFIDYDSRDSVSRAAMWAYYEASLRQAKDSREFFRSHAAKGRVVEIRGAGHSAYLTHADETLKIVRAYLAEVL